MKPFGSYVAVALMLAWFLAMTQAGEPSGTAKSQPTGTFQLKVSNDKLSLDANQAPLVQIFQEIGKQSRIIFDSNIGPEEKITIHLNRVPLEDAIKQLARNVTVFYTENPKDKTRRIERVVVLSQQKEGPSAQPKKSPEAGKPGERAPEPATLKKPSQPEPFKFEFDPAKSAEKEKARKQP